MRAHQKPERAAGSRRGWTLFELVVVILLVAVGILIATVSVYRGKAAADELACQDNMRAIHSSLGIYFTKNHRNYPADQAAFEAFLQDRVYFTEELRCPRDAARTLHYQYARSATNPGPEGITITCPVADSGHGSL